MSYGCLAILSLITHTIYFLFSEYHKASGFIAELEVDGQKKVLLMTCNHVFPSLSAAQESFIHFERLGDDNEGKAIKGEELFNIQFFKTDDTEVRLLYPGAVILKNVLFSGCIIFFHNYVAYTYTHRLKVGGKDLTTLLLK